ncbi:MAG: hypothetical protein ACI8UO_002190 [Verrucomicrobiales bacterium]|jgi:hypothetical protein
MTTQGVHPQPNHLISSLQRRAAIKLGLVGGLGVGLADLLRSEAHATEMAAPPAKAKSVIFLWLQGGVSHHDSFDMKTEASREIRGEFTSIPTNLPGYHVCELMPEIAKTMDKMAVLRSVTHGEAAHQRGSIYMVEGRRPAPATGVSFSGNPHLGSMVSHQLGMRNGMPAHVSIPGNDFTSGFVGNGFLPRSTAAFRQTDAKTLLGSDVSGDRFGSRVGLLKELDKTVESARQQYGDQWDQFSEQAIDIVTSGRAAAAFDIEQEPQEVRDAYGADGKNQMGDLCLRARRLVESGVRFVTIGRQSWDHHSNIFKLMRDRLPRNDRAIAALIRDLYDRGMLEETLVVVGTEFGRTPKVNATAGRDHWPKVFSMAFAGGGIGGGRVIGSSDKIGGEPTSDPASPEELAATILHLTGIHPQTEVMLSGNRPFALIDKAKPFANLLA